MLRKMQCLWARAGRRGMPQVRTVVMMGGAIVWGA